MKGLLTEDDWRRLKEACEDLQLDVGRSIDALLIRAGAALDAAEGLAPGQVRGLRVLTEALALAARDIDDRFAAFERRLNAFRPTSEGA